LDEEESKPRHWFTSSGLTNGRRSKLHTTLPMITSVISKPICKVPSLIPSSVM
jgi:hypothetical protein